MESGIGAGISAMPSLHVAMAVFWTWIGSFHLGWHYALDGLVSLIGVILIWRFARWSADILSAERPRAAVPM